MSAKGEFKATGNEGDGEKVADVLAKYKSQIDEVKGKLDSKLVTSTTDDVSVYRFLRHNKFDVSKSVTQLNATLKWRAEYKCDEIRTKVAGWPQEKFPHAERIAKYFPLNWAHKTDRKGRICEIDFMGHSRPAQLAKEMSLKDFTEFFLTQWERTMEHVNKETARTGQIQRMVQISDMNGLGLKHLDMAGLAHIEAVTTLFQTHYPDLLAEIFIVNAPWLFSTFWKLSSSWLAEEVRNSTHMLPSVDDLKHYFDPANLPVHLGGKCECKGGCIREVDPDEGFTKVDVAAGKFHQVKQEVEKGALVSWEYRSRGGDIQFAASFTPKGGNKEVLVKLTRRAAHIRGMDGGFEAKQEGTLVLSFDNQYSAMTGKVILYRLDKQRPETLDKSLADKLDTKGIEAQLARLNVEEKKSS